MEPIPKRGPGGSYLGERRGGRKKGTPNKATQSRKDALSRGIADAIARLGEAWFTECSPKDVLMLVMRESARTGLVAEAMAAAVAVAPYCHPKFGTIEAAGSGEPLTIHITGGLPDD